MKLILNRFSLKSFFLIFILSISTYQVKNNYSKELEKNNLENKIELQNDYYLLGPGDTIEIKFLNDENLSTTSQILSDGSVSIPLIDPIYLNGLNLKQAKEKITKEMSKELIKPIVQISIINFRPVRVSLIGELKKPGNYILDKEKSIENSAKFIFPTLSDAIQQAGGITPNSNINEILIARKLPPSQKFLNNELSKTEYKMTTVNLYELIMNGKQENNPYLFDGDIIKIKKLKVKNKDFVKISKANFIDQDIEVNVIGEVENPSLIKLPSNSSLLQGVLKAGGLKNTRAKKSNIELIRLDKEKGIIRKKYYDLDLSKGAKVALDVILQDNDVVVVKRSSLAKLSDSLSAISNPISSTLQIYTLLKIID